MIAWAGVDATGGTNWTLSSTSASSGWGMTCFVFRDTDGFDNMYYNEAFDTSAEGTTPVDWLWDNSAMVVMVNDALGESVTGWMTVNSYTPTLGNGGVEVQAVSSGTIGFHVGCYPDNGPAGSALFGINAGGIMSYGFLAIEVLGSAGGGSGGNTATVSWLKA